MNAYRATRMYFAAGRTCVSLGRQKKNAIGQLNYVLSQWPFGFIFILLHQVIPVLKYKVGSNKYILTTQIYVASFRLVKHTYNSFNYTYKLLICLTYMFTCVCVREKSVKCKCIKLFKKRSKKT